jgi:hypothetical protein
MSYDEADEAIESISLQSLPLHLELSDIELEGVKELLKKLLGKVKIKRNGRVKVRYLTEST